MRFVWLILCFGIWFAALTPINAVANGSEVIVIYNSAMPESKAVAEYYAERRQVPTDQIFGFELSQGNDLSRKEYRATLERPLLDRLLEGAFWRLGEREFTDTNGKPVKVEGAVLESKIRYVALCYGVPLRILPDPDLKEPVEETTRPEFRRNEAAVDSELACLPLLSRKFPLAGPLRNSLYTATNAAWFHPTNGMLMVTRLDGPTPEIARRLMDKAMQAENEGLWGRAYFDWRNVADPNMKLGDDWIRTAADMSRHLGFETITNDQEATFSPSFPMSQIAIYMGWYRQNVDGPFTLPNVEFMPGAFAYHLHSFSAATVRSTNTHWAGPLLAKGATATMGCVHEPYLGGTPDLGVFMARLCFDKFTFGEAAYASQNVLSWMTTVVGDPLYRPFAKPPQQLHQELEAKKSKLTEWSHLRVVNLNQARGASTDEQVSYLEQIPTTKESAVLSEKLGDLCAALGKPSSTVHAYERALKLDPSPQQRIRLRLTLGEKQLALNREEEAYANYQKFVVESPDYPEKTPIYQKLLTLAQKLGKKEDAAKYTGQIKPPPPIPPN
jgi:uncharacterized protein (TIGR03790 family)